MKTLLIIAVVVVIAIVLKACVSGVKRAQESSSTVVDKQPITEKQNDKIIVVSGVSHDDIKKALTDFCNIYNKDKLTVLPRLWQLSSNTFAVTFPYDVDFAGYCFAINYLKYPSDIKWHAGVRAWATTKPGDDWITDKSVNKHVILFLADDDNEYDNVFLTTQDNIGYKLGFAVGHEKQLLNAPKVVYNSPTVDVVSLTTHNYEDFR